MNPGEMLSRMLVLIAQKFDGKFDKAGKPYVLHLLTVMHYANAEDEELQCIALGHDLLEDTDVSAHWLHANGFSDRVIKGIETLTKSDDDTERTYLDRILANPDAIVVKLADLRHNSDANRLPRLTEKDVARLAKYGRMTDELSAAAALLQNPRKQ